MQLLRASAMVAGLIAIESAAVGQFFPQAQVPQQSLPDEPVPQPPMTSPAIQTPEPGLDAKAVAAQPQSLAQQVADLQSEVSALQTIVADLTERLLSTGFGNTADQQGGVLFTNSPGRPLYCQMRLQSMKRMFSWIHEHEINSNNRNVRSVDIMGWFPVYHNCFDKRDNSPVPEPTLSGN